LQRARRGSWQLRDEPLFTKPLCCLERRGAARSWQHSGAAAQRSWQRSATQLARSVALAAQAPASGRRTAALRAARARL
jgi:hypothetical protein